MLKKLLYLFIILALNMTAAKAQDLLVTPSDTINLDTTSSCQAETIMTYVIKNTTSQTLQMNWRVVYSTFPHGWLIDYCDPLRCLSSSQIGASTWSFTLDSGTTGLMQFEPTPSSGTACGVYQVFTWASNDSANTATYLTYKLCITTPLNCTAAGITETDIQQISLYPNPVRSEMKVILPQALSNGQIDIYNLIGSKVYSGALTSTTDIDVSSLEGGIYIARISEAGHTISTKKFTKVD